MSDHNFNDLIYQIHIWLSISKSPTIIFTLSLSLGLANFHFKCTSSRNSDNNVNISFLA